MTQARAWALLAEQRCKHALDNPALSTAEFLALRNAYIDTDHSAPLGALMHGEDHA